MLSVKDKMIKLTVEPYDVLFFGSGKPFNMGDVAKSLYLPMPHTVAGAVSAFVYENLGKIPFISAIYGPFLEYEGTIYVPAPANLLTGRKGEGGVFLSFPEGGFRLLNIGNTNVEGVKKLFFYRGREKVEGFRGFISLEALKEYIQHGKIKFNKDDEKEKDKIKTLGDFVLSEGRVGIKLSPESGTTEENALYRIWFSRFKKNVRLVVWLKFGDKDGFAPSEAVMKLLRETAKAGVMKLGGEMRMVRFEAEEGDPHPVFGGISECKEDTVCNVLFLTPGVFGTWNPFGEVEAVAVPGYVPVGINLRYMGNFKNTIQRAIPSGSVFFGVKLSYVESNLGFLTVDNGDAKVVKEYNGFVPYIGGGQVLLWRYENGGRK